MVTFKGLLHFGFIILSKQVTYTNLIYAKGEKIQLHFDFQILLPFSKGI